MPKQYVTDLDQGDLVSDVFLLSSIDLKTTRTGSLYMSMSLTDRTGSIPAVKWDRTRKLFADLPRETYIRVRGSVELYRDKPQVIVQMIEVVDDESVDYAEFLPTTEKDMEKLWTELGKALASIENTFLRELTGRFIEDKELMNEFRRCPAALGMHHAYIGGLLEHTHSVVMLAGWVTKHFSRLDRDLLVAGAFLHDIGKVKEYSYKKAISPSDRGWLVGHLIFGSHMIHEKAALITGFPEELRDVLDHLILSHHGQYEFGSPRLPMTAEAIMLHYMDNMDAKMNGFYRLVDESADTEALWTGWEKMFESRLYRGTVLDQTKEDNG